MSTRLHPRPLALLAVVVLTSCGLDDATAGVEVVSAVASEPVGGDGLVVEPPPNGPAGEARAAEVGVVVDADLPGATVPLPLPLPTPANVAVIGDSLTLSAKDEIEVALTDVGLDVLIVDGVENRRMAQGGRDLPPGVDAIDAILDFGLEPELWIIALGTNDVGAGVDEASFRADVAEVLTTVPAGAPVIWIDLWIRDRAEAVAEANRVIRSVSAIRPSTLIVDWYQYGDDPGIVISDGVHLTDDGQVLFAATMASAVEVMFGG